MYRKDDSFLENIFRSQNEKFGRVLHVFVVLPGKKMNENNGMRGNMKTMGREKLLLALHSGHSFTTAER